MILLVAIILIILTIIYLNYKEHFFSFQRIMFKDSLIKSNTFIINILESNKPFIISRLGGPESWITYHYSKTKKVKKSILRVLSNNAGIYNTNNNNDCIKKFCELYENCIQNSYISVFKNLIKKEQSYFINKFNLSTLSQLIYNPLQLIYMDGRPWTHYLEKKKVLIIHPFIDSFKIQLNNNFNLYKGGYLFSKNQKFIFYKPYNTAGKNHIHKNWLETYNIMCKDISKLDFDIALLGCGGYGLPLCYYIYKNMNKSAIYVGGFLQLFFGVIGRRWETEYPNFIDYIKKNNIKLIRPNKNEQIKNKNKIEKGCYW